MKFKRIRESNETNAAMETMLNSMSFSDDGEVGPFWYDTRNNELFGVESVPASSVQYYVSNTFKTEVKTGPKLHQDIWKKQLQRNQYTSHPDKRFSGDYTKIPRGRVFEIKDKGFIVYTGNWITDYPQAKEQIILEFNLPETTQFRIDSHWDIGHGWSQELM